MAVSVRLDSLMQKEVALCAKRQGVSKSQFMIATLERALSRKDPYRLLLEVKGKTALLPQARQWRENYSGESADPCHTEQSGEAMRSHDCKIKSKAWPQR